jgi:uncharacterized protein
MSKYAPYLSRKAHDHTSAPGLEGDIASVGVIVHDRGGSTEELLAAFAQSLRARGWNVGGLVQYSSKEANGKGRKDLLDLRTGTVYRISQNLGRFSDACCLDPSGLADASQVLRRDIEAGVDLLVANKFSGSESEGDGLAAEMFGCISHGIPLLTTLALRYKPQWDDLTGGIGEMLEADEQALWRWWQKVKR